MAKAQYDNVIVDHIHHAARYERVLVCPAYDEPVHNATVTLTMSQTEADALFALVVLADSYLDTPGYVDPFNSVTCALMTFVDNKASDAIRNAIRHQINPKGRAQ
jgi:hypothetical protein